MNLNVISIAILQLKDYFEAYNFNILWKLHINMEDIYEPKKVFTKHQLHLKAYPNTRMIFFVSDYTYPGPNQITFNWSMTFFFEYFYTKTRICPRVKYIIWNKLSKKLLRHVLYP